MQSPPPPQHRRGPGQIFTVGLLIVALVAAGLLGQAARGFQDRHVRAAGLRAGGTPLGDLDSYALALLLGGLRGPLVMMLWINSESQKIERDLEGLDSQIEWIRLLQPEFDTVHLFQIWNKAYNISVQMVGLSNKYATILDALDYGHNVLAERPTNINLLNEVARVYSHKLGDSAEKDYYRRHVRIETLPPIRATIPADRAADFQRAIAAVHLDDEGIRIDPAGPGGAATAMLTAPQARQLEQFFSGKLPPGAPAAGLPTGQGISFRNVADEILQKGQPGWRRLRMDVMLDIDGNILPQYSRDLEYLKQLAPFPYGLSPFAFAYNYGKRAQLTLAQVGESPKQVSETVIDSRPGLELRAWAEEEIGLARRAEFKLFGLAAPVDAVAAHTATADVPLTQALSDPWAFEAARYNLDHSSALCAAALEEYERHLADPRFPDHRITYQSHLGHLRALQQMTQADEEYLRAMVAPPADRPALLKSAREHYRASWQECQELIARYFIAEDQFLQAFPPGRNELLSKGTLEQRWQAIEAILVRIRQPDMMRNDFYFDDRAEYLAYSQRAIGRLAQIAAALGS